MNSIADDIKAWANNIEPELPLNVLCYRVMTMVAYLGENGKHIHHTNDLGTAYAIGYSLQHLPELSAKAIEYVLGAYHALADYYKENDLSPLNTDN